MRIQIGVGKRHVALFATKDQEECIAAVSNAALGRGRRARVAAGAIKPAQYNCVLAVRKHLGEGRGVAPGRLESNGVGSPGQSLRFRDPRKSMAACMRGRGRLLIPVRFLCLQNSALHSG